MFKLIFGLYGNMLNNMNKLNYFLPTIRNIVAVNNVSIIDITIRYYVILFLLKFNFLTSVITYIDIPLQKIKVDYCINNNLYSVIFIKDCNIIKLVNLLNIFITNCNLYLLLPDYDNNIINFSKLTRFNILYNDNNSNYVDELEFINKTLKRFRGVDNLYNKSLSVDKKLEISTKLLDILQLSYKKYNVQKIEINIIPNIIIHKNQEDIQQLNINDIE